MKDRTRAKIITRRIDAERHCAVLGMTLEHAADSPGWIARRDSDGVIYYESCTLEALERDLRRDAETQTSHAAADNPISVSEVIGKANDLCRYPDSPLPFYYAALALGADKSQAQHLDTLACAAVMWARGAI